MKISVLIALTIVFLLLLGATAYVLLGPEPEPPRDYDSRQQHLRALETASIVRSSVQSYFWETYKAADGKGRYPDSLNASMFPGGKIPTKSFGIYSWEYDPKTGDVKVVISTYGRVRLKLKEMLGKIFSPFLGDQAGTES